MSVVASAAATSRSECTSLPAPDFKSIPIHVDTVVDPASIIFANPHARKCDGALTENLISAVAIHIETVGMHDWKQHMKILGVKYSTEDDVTLNALHESIVALYNDGICFQDPTGLTIRVVKK